MDFFSGSFSWEMAGWGALAVLGMALVAFIGRIWRGGLGTLGESQEKMAQRIRDTSADIRDRNNAMPASEQLQILDAALREVLELENNPVGCAVHRSPKGIGLSTPGGDWLVVFAARQSTLRGGRRVMHGAGQWQVRHDNGETQVFNDLGQLMRFLRTVLGSAQVLPAEETMDPEFARRFSRRPVRHAGRPRT